MINKQLLFISVIQSNHSSSCSSPWHQTGSSTASLLLVCQDSKRQPYQSANQMQRQADGQQPYQQLAGPEAPPSVQLLPQQSLPLLFASPKASVASRANASPIGITTATTQLAAPVIQVKEESRRALHSGDPSMDTQLEAEPCDRGGEELDISFDSQFPDLISDLITEEANPLTAPPILAPNPVAFPAGIRYMVPPQPLPSSSFLPFPHPLPSSSSLPSITDFSPEWSYPEVINHQ